MDDFEERLQRYRPAGPPPELRERIVDAASRRAAARTAPAFREWLPAAAALALTMVFYWLAASERQMLDASFTPVPPIDQAIAVISEEPER